MHKINDYELTVILPVYNAQDYISECMESILNQTYGEFRLLVIDDGSSDSSLSILKRFAHSDKRITLISKENEGLISTLNQALSLTNTRYIARMDADDICELDRFENQISYMRRHDLAISGGSYNIIDEKGAQIGYRKCLAKYSDVKTYLLFGCPLAHSAAMLDTSKIMRSDLFYDLNYPCAEDYELWVRLSKKYKIGNIQKKLITVRVCSNGISKSNEKKQIDNAIYALEQHFDKNLAMAVRKIYGSILDGTFTSNVSNLLGIYKTIRPYGQFFSTLSFMKISAYFIAKGLLRA